MLGTHEFPKSDATEAAAGRRAALRALLVGASAAVGFFIVAGAAQAQDCVGGYRMLKGEIPVACDGGIGQSAVAPNSPLASEALHTGSINGLGAGGGNADEIPAATSPSGAKCVGGYAYRPTANESYITMPMRCE